MEILFQDNEIVVLIKEPGMESEKLTGQAVFGSSDPLFCVHRLDKQVGGVMVYARTETSAAKLSEDFKERRTAKKYLALVAGCPDPKEGDMEDYLYHDKLKNKSYVVKKRAGAKLAILSYKVLTEQSGTSLVEVLLHTGRTHQIRVQFASRKMPLLGDKRYGSDVASKDIALWSYSLCFNHPKTGETLTFTKYPPKEGLWKPIYLDSEYVKNAFPTRSSNSNKGDFGYVTLLGGCEKYTGAIRLAGMAACAARAGAGVVQIAVPKSLAGLVGSQILESTVYPLSEQDGAIKFEETEIASLCTRCKAIAFGMGVGIGEGQKETLRFILEHYDGNLIIDADGLTILSEMLRAEPLLLKSSKAGIILTPHLKEFSRLTGLDLDDIKQNPISLAREFAKEHDCVVLLKGSTTIITDGANINLVDRGCPGMATAGSGDVLAGIMAGICGYNRDCLLAASAAAYVNGIAGEMAQEESGAISLIASDTARHVMQAIKEITKKA